MSEHIHIECPVGTSEREAACWWTKAGTVRVRLYALEAAP
jgi:hypothetical protein